jgi:hypothetical protein
MKRHILVLFTSHLEDYMRIPTMIAATAVAALAATVVTGTPAQAVPVPGPTLLMPTVKTVHSGKPTWVKTYWGTTRDICDAKVTVQVAGTVLEYPSNTATYTSFARDDTLAAGATDYTAFRVTATTDHNMVRAVHLTIGYRARSNYGCTGPVMTRSFYAMMAVREH